METPSRYRFVSLPRKVDFALVEHRWMAVLTAAGGLAAAVQSALSGASSIVELLGGALIGAIGVFLTWAIARELDPDHPSSALIAGVVGVALLLAWGAPSILVSGWVLLLLRLVARTTGLTPRPADTLAAVGVGLVLGLVRDSSLLLLTAVGLALDGWMPPEHGNHKYAALGLAFAGVAAQIAPLSAQASGAPLPALAWVALGAVAAVFLGLVLSRWEVAARADQTGEPLNPQRVHAGQVLGVLLAVGLPLAQGVAGFQAQGALWGAISGIALFQVIPADMSALLKDEQADSEG